MIRRVRVKRFRPLPERAPDPEAIALSDRQADALVTLGKLMGDPSDEFDRELQEHMDRRHARELRAAAAREALIAQRECAVRARAPSASSAGS
jgi:hypothetical protein